LGLNVLRLDEFLKSTNNTNCVCLISSISELALIGSLMKNTSPSIFIATWSLSESPIEVREEVSVVATKCTNALIAFQSHFGEVDNLEYFKEYTERFAKVDWVDFEIHHLPGNYYLLGKS
jgi:hypothetical protein